MIFNIKKLFLDVKFQAMNTSAIIFLLSGLIAIISVYLIFYSLHNVRRKKILKKIRAEWGHPKTEWRNFEQIENFSTVCTSSSFHKLDKQTLNDIDFYDLFENLDRTQSRPGQQYLFNKLITPTDDISQLKLFNEQVIFFSENAGARENAQLLLEKLSNYDAYYIVNLLGGDLSVDSKFKIFYIADTLTVIAMLLFSTAYPILLIWLIIPLTLNVVIHFINRNKKVKFIKSFPWLKRLIAVSQSLIQKGFPFENMVAQKNINNLKRFKRMYNLLSFGEDTGEGIHQLFFYLFDMIKALFLVETHTFRSIVQELKYKKEDIENLIIFIGGIDAAISTASLRAGAEAGYCIPKFLKTEKSLSATKMYHPLIPGCTPNSIEVNAKSVLLTGSNMSGKSTFIRSIAINIILAQTIYTCFAEKFHLPFLKVFSSIRISDNLEQSASYYLNEVNAVGNLIKESDTSFQNLFILDEIFKGTNTIERIAGAKAVLSYLNKKENIVFVSTHDIELAELLHSQYALYHFTENVENDTLLFDHQLKPGPLKTRNAIKIMALANYPEAIIKEAELLSGKY